MVKKLRLGGTQIKSAYWSLVGMASAMMMLVFVFRIGVPFVYEIGLFSYSLFM